MAKQVPETRTAVLKLRFGDCRTCPTKRMVADLHRASALFNTSRNAMIRYWERWCEDNVFTRRDVRIKGKTVTVKDDDGKVLRVIPPQPRDIAVREAFVPDNYQLPKGFSTELYHAGRVAAGDLLAPNAVAAASNEILSFVNKTLPYAPGRRHRRVWQAILGSECSRPEFRATDFVVPNQNAKLTLKDDGYHFTFPVWSSQAGRKNTSYACRLATRRLTAGYKAILFNVANGTYKLCDSELIFHEGTRQKPGFWALHLCYQRPQEPLGLDKSRVATFVPQKGEAEQPFEITCADAFPSQIGDAFVLQHEYRRLDDRRFHMRKTHRNRTSGRRGHGRQRIESAVRPVTRAVRQLMHRFSWHVVSEVVRYCVRHNCGTVLYDEPAVQARAGLWFAKHDIPYDWTGLVNRLKHKLWLADIELRESTAAERRSRESGSGERKAGGRSRDGSKGRGKGSGDGAAKRVGGRAKKQGALAEAGVNRGGGRGKKDGRGSR